MKVQATLLALLFSAACGAHDDKKKDPAAPQDGTGAGGTGVGATVDTNLAADTVTGGVDEAISSAVEENEAESSTGLTLADGAGAAVPGFGRKGAAKRFRECAEDGGHAKVTIEDRMDVTVTRTTAVRTSEVGTHYLWHRDRDWSRADGTPVACGPMKKAAKIDVDAMAGVNLAVGFERSGSRSATTTNKKNGKTVQTSAEYKATGTRNIAWQSADAQTGGNLLLVKEVAIDATRTAKVTSNNVSKESSGSLKTGDKLVIAVERDPAAGHAVVSRTIKSGSIVAVSNGNTITTTFADVKYVPNDGCFAVSGSIKGSVLKSGETTPGLTFEVSFSGDEKKIVFSNGDEVDYTAEGCVLEEPAKVEEAPSADAAKAEPTAAEEAQES
jgi:hypothetical protein